MSTPQDPSAPARPCKYCIANWTGMTKGSGKPILPEPSDCEMTHRDDPRVYGLAHALASVFQQRNPTDEQIAWFLTNADEAVDDFDPAPQKWRVRRLPMSDNDGSDGIDVRLRINDVTYVGLEGGKDSNGSMVKLSTFRSWHKED